MRPGDDPGPHGSLEGVRDLCEGPAPPVPPTETLSVIIAARNEAAWLPGCLDSLLAQDAAAGPVQVVVSANACTDDTVAVARARQAAFAARGWRLDIVEREAGGKPGALNAGDAIATGAWRLYLDADIVCEPVLLGQLRTALAIDAPRYATGRLRLAPARSWVSRCYGRFWMRLPFVQQGAPGAGLFAVNTAGRARWGAFPELISDDGFVRLHFAPHERVEVAAGYRWPVVEGFPALVRVRRRQDRGMAELVERYPDLAPNGAGTRPGPGTVLRLAARDPVGFAVYTFVALAVRRGPAAADWSRGR